MATNAYKEKFAQALKAGTKRDYKTSEKLFTEILAETDSMPEAWLFLGRSRYAQGDYERALSAFTIFLREKKDNPSGLFFLGRTYLAISHPRQASYYLRKSMELGKASAEHYALLGFAELKLKHSGKATEYLEAAVSIAPENKKIFKAYINALGVHAIRSINKDPQEAANMLSFVINNGGDGLSQHLYRAKALRCFGNIEEAISELEYIIINLEDDPSIRLQLAALYFGLGQVEKAMEQVQASGISLPDIKNAPWTEDALERYRALLAFKDGDYKTASNIVTFLIRNGQNDASLRAIAAQANYEMGNYEKASAHYKRAIELDQNTPDFRLGLALSLWNLGDYSGAKAAVRAASVRHAPKDDVEYIELMCDAKLGASPEQILPHAQAQLRNHPGNPGLMLILAESLYKTSYPDLAKSWFESVISVWPDHELSYLYLISISESLRNDKEAIKDYAEYLKRWPDNFAIRKDFVSLLIKKEQWKRAASVMEDGFAFDPTKKNTVLIAVCYKNAGKYKEAAAAYRNLLRAEPENVDYLLGLALCLHKMGSDQTIELLERGAKYIKKKAEPFLVLGVLKARKNDKEGAINAFTKASELAPADPRPHSNLALIYKQSGLTEMAKKHEQKAKSLSING